MKQLPGLRSRTLPRLFKTIMVGTITVIVTIWLLYLLPFLLLAALMFSIAHIPDIRRLRRDIEKKVSVLIDPGALINAAM